jgi:hypothetical protein
MSEKNAWATGIPVERASLSSHTCSTKIARFAVGTSVKTVDKVAGVISSMKSPKRKRISNIKAGILIVDQVKPTIPKRTAVRFDVSKGKSVK